MSEKVTLLAYDISMGMAKGMSMMLVGQQIDAIYHTAIAVFGREYYFGGGICNDPIKQTPYGKPIEEVPIGETEIPKEVFEEWIKDISPRYTTQSYDIIEHNCNMFCDEAAEFLIGKGIDKKYVNQGRDLLKTPAGQMFAPMLKSMQGGIQHPQPGFYQ